MRLFRSILITMRPRQWSKNTLLFAALIFSKNVFNLEMLKKSIAGFIVLCMISGSAYILNDIIDRDNDRKHPLKSKRPIAAGELSISAAVLAALFSVGTGLAVSWFLSARFFIIVVFYLLLQLSYSLLLKRVVIIDVLAITTGFVLRVLGGAVVIHVAVSSWLLVCTFLLALFLALCKRRHELTLLGSGAQNHRSVLGEYSIPLLDQMISVSTASTVLSYALYTVSEQTVAKFNTENLIYTVPFVVYGIFRYLYLVHIRKEGGSPETALLTDLPLIAAIIIWATVAGLIIYF